MAVNIGPKIGIEGEAEYRKQINGIIQQSKTLAAQMKALTTSFDKSNKSLSDNAKQHKLLGEQIKTQEQKLSELNSMLSKSEEKFGENSEKTLKWKQAVAEAEAELNRLKGELDSLPSSLDLMAGKFADTGKKLESIGKGMSEIGSKMTSTITAGVGAAFGASIKSAIDWESAFTGVMKTVDETVTTSYDDLAQSIMKLSTETASSKSEIAAVAEAAGQLGVSADDIEDFTRTMVMLGDTTNLSAEEAASALAKFTNITGSGNSNVDKLGASIVALGNNFATTEADIVHMSTRLAAAGTLSGLSETDILALATAMSSVGIEAEAGGTAMTQTMTAIEAAVSNFRAGSTEDLEAIANIAELSADDFANAWEKHPIGAIQSFIQGLGELDKKGESATLILGEIGMSGVRQSNMLKSLALASDKLNSAVELSSEAYKENTALTDEANKRYKTFAAQLTQLKESVSNIAIAFGNDLLPYVQKGVDFVKKLVEQFGALSEEERGQIIKFAAIAAAIGPILMGGGKLIALIGKIMQFAPQLATVVQGAASAFGGIGAGAGAALAPVAAVAAAIGVLVAAFMNLWNNNAEFKAGMLDTWNGIKESFSGFVSAIQERMPQIQEAFNNVISVIKPLWEGYCQLLAPAFQAAFDAVKAVLDLLFNAIISVIDMLTGIFTADKELFMQGLTMFLQSIWTYLVQWWTILYTWITTTINTFLAWFGTSLEDIVTRITEFFSNLWDTIVEKVTEIVDWVTEKINEICDFISSLPDRFYQWGVEMIQNLAQGIRDTIGAVTEAISSVAEAIAEFIHFSEPDVGPLSNFNSFMPDMMKQMAQGIEKGRWQVRAAAANVARDIAAPIATTNNVTMNNSFTFGGGYTEADGRDIVRKINRQLGALYI